MPVSIGKCVVVLVISVICGDLESSEGCSQSVGAVSIVIGAAAPNVFVSVRLSARSPQPQPDPTPITSLESHNNLYQDHKIFIHRQSLWPENIQLSGNHSINLCHPPTHKKHLKSTIYCLSPQYSVAKTQSRTELKLTVFYSRKN